MTIEIVKLADNRTYRLYYDNDINNILSPEQRKIALAQNGIYSEVISVEVQTLQADSITVTSPIAGDSWNAGTSYNVTWTSTGNAMGGNVLIELLKGGSINGQISCSAPNNGTFAWAPSTINIQGSDYQVRVTKIGTTYSDITPDFTIVSASLGKMNVIYPSCGEKLFVGATYNILWEGFGDAAGGNVDITLEDGGILDRTIATGVANSGSYNWQIPSNQTLGTNFRVIVTKPGTPAYRDSSNVPLTIAAATNVNLTLNVVTAGWGTIDLYLYDAPTGNWNLLGSVSNSQSFTIPAGSQIAALAMSYADYSFTKWIINGITESFEQTLALTLDADITLDVYFEPSIALPATNLAQNASFTTDPASTYDKDISQKGTAGTATLSWATDAYHSSNHSIKIVNTSVTNSYSNYTRWLSKLLPVVAGRTYNASVWIKTLNSWRTRFRVVWFKGTPGTCPSPDTSCYNGEMSITPDVTGTTAGTVFVQKSVVSEMAPGNTTYARLEFMQFGSGTSWFDDVILEDVSITVTAPNGGENWQKGTVHDITWDSSGIPTSTSSPSGRIGIELQKAGTTVLVIRDGSTNPAPNNGTYSWTVPTTLTTGTDYKIKVYGCTVCTSPYTWIGDVSNANFNITDTATINIIVPDATNISWETGTTKTITWSTTGTVTNVKIELLKGGILNTTLTSSTTNDGSYDWAIPSNQSPGTDYTIKITDTTNAAITDTSTNNFTIFAPSITVSSPNGGENFRSGTTQTLSWTSEGTIANVKIELLKGDVYYSTIITSTSNTSTKTYDWAILSNQALGNDYKIRISDVTNSATNDNSNANFTISPPAGTTITLTAPNGLESWQAGSNQTIRWTSVGNPGNVKIELLKGVVASTIIDSTSNSGSYIWQIPTSQETANNYRIKITSVFDSTIGDNSDNDFTISNACPTPASDFTFTVNGYAVSFTDATTFPANSTSNSWSWNFGEPSSSTNTSTLQSPSHTYAAFGTYTVSLTASNSCGAGTPKSKTVSICITPVSDFSCTPSNCKIQKDAAIQFTDASTFSPTGWSWDFGDPSNPNNSSTIQNPIHTYPTAGDYTVQLTASNSCGDGVSATKVITVTTTTPPPATSDTGKAVAIVAILGAGVGLILLSSKKPKSTTTGTPITWRK